MGDIYSEIIEELKGLKPKGKVVVSVGGKFYEADYNFNPPRVTRLEVAQEKEEE